jgi:UDP-GlcNAc:undecaprenyl-phosphate GlcNAc-1-phosphate transferase
MTELEPYEYLAVFVATAALTLLLTPLALQLALRTALLDHPGEIKAQGSPVPYLGGAAIVIAFAAAVLGAAVVRPPVSGLEELAIVLGLGVALALMGLLDDIRGLSPWLRLAVEVGAGMVVWATPAGAELTQNAVFDAVITVAWIVVVTNALNLLDNMDGLSAGVAAIASAVIFAMAAHSGQFLVATLALALAGCAVGFLRSNFHPARIYMGDAGSLFLGFMLADLALKLRFEDAPRSLAFAIPVVILGVPLFDTALVTVNRLMHGRSPISGGRDHTSHRLVFVGIPVPITVALIYGCAVSLGVLAFVLSESTRGAGTVLVLWVIACGIFFGVLLSMVPVYETSRRRRYMLQQVAKVDPEATDEAE